MFEALMQGLAVGLFITVTFLAHHVHRTHAQFMLALREERLQIQRVLAEVSGGPCPRCGGAMTIIGADGKLQNEPCFTCTPPAGRLPAAPTTQGSGGPTTPTGFRI